jgi:hypothetical protein
MKKNKFSVLGMLAMVLALGFPFNGCANGNDNTYAIGETVWFGRVETITPLSYRISNNAFTWEHDRRYPAVLTKEGDTYSGGSLAGTVWSNERGVPGGYMRLEFIDATNAKPSWGPLDYMTYTLVGDTVNVVYTRVREGTLTFKEDSTFQFKDRNTQATGTSKVEGDVITLNGVWENGDAGAGTRFEVSGTVSGGAITLTSGVFWGIKIFNKQ